MRESAPGGQEHPEVQESTGISQDLVKRPRTPVGVAVGIQAETYVLEPIPRSRNDSGSRGVANYLVTARRYSWMILLVCVASMLATFLYSTRQRPLFQASATFLVADPKTMYSRGVPLGVIFRNHPSFLVEHALNPELLNPLLLETFLVPGESAPIVLLDYLGIPEDRLSERLYLGRSILTRRIEVSAPNRLFPFFLSINVSLEDPEMASQIANRLLERLSEVDTLRHAKSSKEHTALIEMQIEAAELDLRAAEETLEKFLDANRLVSTARLAVQKRRLEREVELQSNLFIELRTRLAVSRLKVDEEMSSVTIIERASPPHEPYTLHAGTQVVLAGIAGIVLVLVLTGAAEFFGRGRVR